MPFSAVESELPHRPKADDSPASPQINCSAKVQKKMPASVMFSSSVGRNEDFYRPNSKVDAYG